ncbi:hypothetical protein AB0758_43915 [Tolypothrix bouteillei VB521301_2]|uniref:hypothetical protein n=2 Tax=Tolypothrix bouteillei TaxID=1246981 RepID=UPI0005145D80
MSVIAIVQDLDKWEKQIIESTNKLFAHKIVVKKASNETPDLPIYNQLLGEREPIDNHDLRLNLAYSLYLISQITKKTQTSKLLVNYLKKDQQKAGIYCPTTDLILGLDVMGYKLKSDKYFNCHVNLSSKSQNQTKKYKLKHREFWPKIKQAIEDANPQYEEIYYVAIESIAWIENNQILTNEINFQSIYKEHYNIIDEEDE